MIRLSDHPRPSQAFTLIEMTLSLVILSILFLAVQSVVVLASRVTTDDKNRSAATQNVAKGIDWISADLPFATSVAANTSKSITFTVPDRNSDGQPETIRYSWSGTNGDPLLRSVNGGADATVVAKVGTFQLLYDTDTTTTQNYTESAETVLQSYDALLSLGDGDIDSNNWVGQYFTPSLPSAATSWRVSHVKFKARTHGANAGETRVQMRRAKNGLPTTVIDETVMYENTLSSSYAWQDVAFSNVTNITPTEGLCLVLQWQKDADACDIQVQALLALGSGSTLVKTTNAGSSWSAPAAQDMLFYVYGTYKTPSTTTATYTLRRARVKIVSSVDANASVLATVSLLNPQTVSGP